MRRGQILTRIQNEQITLSQYSILNKFSMWYDVIGYRINVLSTMRKNIQPVLESDADCEEETIDQPMLPVPLRMTSNSIPTLETKPQILEMEIYQSASTIIENKNNFEEKVCLFLFL